ncbi:CREB-regulated transcription coactivator 3 [Cricetulus griseus]|nr:CREB-regulated transcription coactivator 3 [Cricetulus griseus]
MQVQFQKLQQLRLTQYHGGSLPNVSQLRSSTSEFQGAGNVAQQLRAFAALAEDPSLVLSAPSGFIHTVAGFPSLLRVNTILLKSIPRYVFACQLLGTCVFEFQSSNLSGMNVVPSRSRARLLSRRKLTSQLSGPCSPSWGPEC